MKKEHAMKCRLRINCGLNHDLTPMPPEDCTCDGYHTFNELYEHRMTLYITLCRWVLMYRGATDGATAEAMPLVWRSKLHSDGSEIKGWFVLGIGEKKGEQITYHLPVEYWNDTSFAKTLTIAPEFDGHSSDDVIDRLKNL